jgi:hypothetical protein
MAAAFVIAWSAHAASDLTIADFVGRFSGEAHSEAGDRFFVATLRDVEVDIQREGDGFRLAWSTLIRDDAPAGDAAAARPRRREAELHFLPAAKPGQFRTAEALEPFADRPAAWAYIDGNALTVQLMTIRADGNYELQTYVRALTGDAMALRFTRIAPGQPDLVVVGQLTRRRD